MRLLTRPRPAWSGRPAARKVRQCSGEMPLLQHSWWPLPRMLLQPAPRCPAAVGPWWPSQAQQEHRWGWEGKYPLGGDVGLSHPPVSVGAATPHALSQVGVQPGPPTGTRCREQQCGEVFSHRLPHMCSRAERACQGCHYTEGTTCPQLPPGSRVGGGARPQKGLCPFASARRVWQQGMLGLQVLLPIGAGLARL